MAMGQVRGECCRARLCGAARPCRQITCILTAC